ncbi:hypothetical protein [Mycobacterium sp. DL440]|nr:hypothetical protein [Mycobacterium sp. DL440]
MSELWATWREEPHYRCTCRGLGPIPIRTHGYDRHRRDRHRRPENFDEES